MSQNGDAFITANLAAPVTGAGAYNWYRQSEVPGGGNDAQSLYGFIGTGPGLQFIDHNINPDFSRTPPIAFDPFANGAIQSITPLTGGSGYSNRTLILVGDPTGAGFVGYPVISGGSIVSVVVQSPGFNYSNPIVLFIDPLGGVGATTNTTVATTGPAFVASIAPDYQGPEINGGNGL
jgi:hypothetical protein